MTKAHNEDMAAIAAAVRALMPAGWDYTLRHTAGTIRLVIGRAPVDLLAEHRRLYGPDERAYAKISPALYDGTVIGALWLALHSRNTVQFDAGGHRVGRWYVVELWIGHYRRPFEVTQ